MAASEAYPVCNQEIRTLAEQSIALEGRDAKTAKALLDLARLLVYKGASLKDQESLAKKAAEIVLATPSLDGQSSVVQTFILNRFRAQEITETTERQINFVHAVACNGIPTTVRDLALKTYLAAAKGRRRADTRFQVLLEKAVEAQSFAAIPFYSDLVAAHADSFVAELAEILENDLGFERFYDEIIPRAKQVLEAFQTEKNAKALRLRHYIDPDKVRFRKRMEEAKQLHEQMMKEYEAFIRQATAEPDYDLDGGIWEDEGEESIFEDADFANRQLRIANQIFSLIDIHPEAWKLFFKTISSALSLYQLKADVGNLLQIQGVTSRYPGLHPALKERIILAEKNGAPSV
ncbi:MAG: hypothetical protein HQ595_01435 [Candidatus Omnitrophica bacterium]|nr:hypothetical protein [Candidatus Omnitrophota bacterium]